MVSSSQYSPIHDAGVLVNCIRDIYEKHLDAPFSTRGITGILYSNFGSR